MFERVRAIWRRRRIRFLKARAKDCAAKALFWMQCMEDDLHELNRLAAPDTRIAQITELEIEAALEAIA